MIVFDIFAPTLTVSHVLTFKVFDLEEIGQDHGKLLSKWRHTMTKINIFLNSVRNIFVLPLTVSDINF